MTRVISAGPGEEWYLGLIEDMATGIAQKRLKGFC